MNVSCLILTAALLVASTTVSARVGCVPLATPDREIARALSADVANPMGRTRRMQLVVPCASFHAPKRVRAPLAERERRMIRGAASAFAEYRTRRAQLEPLRSVAKNADEED